MVTMAIYTPKGGGGKSTHTELMSRVLRDVYGFDVLVIDTDPQGSLNDLHILLKSSDSTETENEPRVNFLAMPITDAIANIEAGNYDNYDVVMFDIQGLLYQTHNVYSDIIGLLKSVDVVVMPIRPSTMDMLSAIKFKPIMEAVNPRCEFVSFLNEYKNNNDCKEIEATLKESGFKLIQRIKSSVHYPRLTYASHNALDKKSKVRDEYAVFADQIVELINEYK